MRGQTNGRTEALSKWEWRSLAARWFYLVTDMRDLEVWVKPTAAPPNNGGSDHSEAVPNAALTVLWRGARLGANKSNVRRAVLARMQSLGGIHETPKQFP
jgi:hypothetical protein